SPGSKATGSGSDNSDRVQALGPSRSRPSQNCRRAYFPLASSRLRDTFLAAVTTTAAADLSVQVGALRLRNPIIAARGTFGYGVAFAPLVDLNRLGGLVVKGLSRQPREGAPPPRLIETPSGMLNAVGLQNIGVRAFVAEKLPELRKYA